MGLRIDVTVATLNSSSTIERCLEAIRASIPVRRLLVVDGGSTDGTVEIAKDHGATVLHEPGLLGRVRYVQAQNCETDWIAYVDSDVYVYSSWWPTVRKFMAEPDIGMVLGYFCDSPIRTLPVYAVYETYLEFNARRYGAIALSNTLIRRRLVLECTELLGPVHAGEDGVIATYIRRKGLSIVTIPVRLCYHDKDVVKSHPSAYYRWGKSIRIRSGMSGLRKVRKVGGILLHSIQNWRTFSVETRLISPRLLAYILRLWIWTVAGFLSTVNLDHEAAVHSTQASASSVTRC